MWRANCILLQLYCHLWPVWLHDILAHYLTEGTIFEKDILNMKIVFCFSLQISSESFLIIWVIQLDFVTNVLTSSRNVPLFPSDVYEIERSDRFWNNHQ
jgi:hypothetical protein